RRTVPEAGVRASADRPARRACHLRTAGWGLSPFARGSLSARRGGHGGPVVGGESPAAGFPLRNGAHARRGGGRTRGCGSELSDVAELEHTGGLRGGAPRRDEQPGKRKDDSR